MVSKRADSFRIALDTLRDELRRGVHAGGARLTANDIASRLALSATPAREALSRLAGEGLLQDRRGQGFFVPSLSEHDLALLFRLQLELLPTVWFQATRTQRSRATLFSQANASFARSRPRRAQRSLAIWAACTTSWRQSARWRRKSLIGCLRNSRSSLGRSSWAFRAIFARR